MIDRISDILSSARSRLILFFLLALAALIALMRPEGILGLISGVVTFLVGFVGLVIAVVIFDQKLKKSGKNGFWLLVFFGPFVTAAAIFEFIPKNPPHYFIIFGVIVAFTCLPTAIWGVHLLSKKLD